MSDNQESPEETRQRNLRRKSQESETERQVREEMGLDQQKSNDKPRERGLVEQLVRQELEHPSPPAQPEPENISVNQFLERYPDQKWVVDDARGRGESDEQIEQTLPYFVKDIPRNVETEVRKTLGVPLPHESKPSPLEEKVREQMHLRKERESHQ